jgi:8-oxo-dGTP pyrophosphatase MutT (NUDIX family)
MVLLQDGKVLMVRHTYIEGWYLPGGGMNRGETPLEAAAREAWEEAGVELLEPPTLLGIISADTPTSNNHVATYLSRNFRIGPAKDQWEIAERRFFTLDELPLHVGDKWRKLLHDLDENLDKSPDKNSDKNNEQR